MLFSYASKLSWHTLVSVQCNLLVHNKKMEFPKNLWNFQKFGLNLPKKLARILLGSISESSFGKFFNLPKLLSHFGKCFRQAISASFFTCQNYFPILESAFGKRFRQVFLLAKTTFPFRQVFWLAETTFRKNFSCVTWALD